jgi:hypothetical protein
VRAISELTGFDRKTIRRYLDGSGGTPVYGPRPAAASKLDPFKAYLKERMPGRGVERAGVVVRAAEKGLQRRVFDLKGLGASAAGGGAGRDFLIEPDFRCCLHRRARSISFPRAQSCMYCRFNCRIVLYATESPGCSTAAL